MFVCEDGSESEVRVRVEYKSLIRILVPAHPKNESRLDIKSETLLSGHEKLIHIAYVYAI